MYISSSKTALRRILNDPFVTAISIGGLSIAFACVMIIAIFIHGKYNSEPHVLDASNIFIVGTIIKPKNLDPATVPFSAPELASLLSQASGSIKQATRRIGEYNVKVTVRDRTSEEEINWVDSNFFQIFRVPVLAGDASSALEKPTSAVVTRSFAERYFSTVKAVGKIITLKNQDYTVTAVLEDFPAGTSLTGSIFVPSTSVDSAFRQLLQERQGKMLDLILTGVNYTYVLVKRAEDIKLVEQDIDRSGRLRSPYPEMINVSFTMVPISRLHLQMPGRADTSQLLISGIVAIAVLIFSVATVNFVNLTAARANSRLKEIAIRRVEGATKRQISLYFILESLIITLIAVILSVIMVHFTERYWELLFSMSFDLRLSWKALGVLLIAMVAFSVTSAAYPLFSLSLRSTQIALRQGTGENGGSSRVRQALISMQFMFVVIVVIVAVLMERQTSYMTNETSAFSPANILVLRAECANAFRNELLKLSAVKRVSCSSAAPFSQSSFDTVVRNSESGTSISLSEIAVDYDFFELYGIRPLAGRLFESRFSTDEVPWQEGGSSNENTVSIVLNESAARAIKAGQSRPLLDIVIPRLLPSGEHGHIIGIVPDFIIGPAFQNIKPTVFFINRQHFELMTVELQSGQLYLYRQKIQELWERYYREKEFEPIFLLDYLNDIYRDIIVERKVFAFLSIVMFVICGVGVLAMTILGIQDRRLDIGIRKIMGADTLNITKYLMLRFSYPVVVGCVFAWPIAYYSGSHWLQSFPYRIDVRLSDFLVFTFALVLMSCIPICFLSFKASRSDPIEIIKGS